jgi:hypothetical protein
MDKAHGLRWVAVLALAEALAPLVAMADEPPRHFSARLGEKVATDDNLFRLPSGLDPALFLGDGADREDRIDTASIVLAGLWQRGGQGVKVDADVASNTFARNAYLDNVSGDATLGWSWRFGGRWSGTLGASAERSLAGFANTDSLAKDVRDTRSYFGEARLDVGPRWRAVLSGRSGTTAHDSELRRGDDVEQRSASVGLVYHTPRESELGWEFREARAAYPEQLSTAGGGTPSDYSEHRAVMTLKYALGSKVSLASTVGYVWRTYELAERGDFAGNVWNAVLKWLPGDNVQIALERFRDVRAHIDAESDHFVTTGSSVSATWAPLEKLALSLRASREDQSYIGADVFGAPNRRDVPTAGGLVLTYTPRERVAFEFSARHEARDSTNARFGYDAGTMGLAAEIRF